MRWSRAKQIIHLKGESPDTGTDIHDEDEGGILVNIECQLNVRKALPMCRFEPIDSISPKPIIKDRF